MQRSLDTSAAHFAARHRRGYRQAWLAVVLTLASCAAISSASIPLHVQSYTFEDGEFGVSSALGDAPDPSLGAPQRVDQRRRDPSDLTLLGAASGICSGPDGCDVCSYRAANPCQVADRYGADAALCQLPGFLGGGVREEQLCGMGASADVMLPYAADPDTAADSDLTGAVAAAASLTVFRNTSGAVLLTVTTRCGWLLVPAAPPPPEEREAQDQQGPSARRRRRLHQQPTDVPVPAEKGVAAGLGSEPPEAQLPEPHAPPPPFPEAAPPVVLSGTLTYGGRALTFTVPAQRSGQTDGAGAGADAAPERYSCFTAAVQLPGLTAPCQILDLEVAVRLALRRVRLDAVQGLAGPQQRRRLRQQQGPEDGDAPPGADGAEDTEEEEEEGSSGSSVGEGGAANVSCVELGPEYMTSAGLTVRAPQLGRLAREAAQAAAAATAAAAAAAAEAAEAAAAAAIANRTKAGAEQQQQQGKAWLESQQQLYSYGVAATASYTATLDLQAPASGAWLAALAAQAPMVRAAPRLQRLSFLVGSLSAEAAAAAMLALPGPAAAPAVAPLLPRGLAAADCGQGSVGAVAEAVLAALGAQGVKEESLRSIACLRPPYTAVPAAQLPACAADTPVLFNVTIELSAATTGAADPSVSFSSASNGTDTAASLSTAAGPADPRVMAESLAAGALAAPWVCLSDEAGMRMATQLAVSVALPGGPGLVLEGGGGGGAGGGAAGGQSPDPSQGGGGAEAVLPTGPGPSTGGSQPSPSPAPSPSPRNGGGGGGGVTPTTAIVVAVSVVLVLVLLFSVLAFLVLRSLRRSREAAAVAHAAAAQANAGAATLSAAAAAAAAAVPGFRLPGLRGWRVANEKGSTGAGAETAAEAAMAISAAAVSDRPDPTASLSSISMELGVEPSSDASSPRELAALPPQPQPRGGGVPGGAAWDAGARRQGAAPPGAQADCHGAQSQEGARVWGEGGGMEAGAAALRPVPVAELPRAGGVGAAGAMIRDDGDGASSSTYDSSSAPLLERDADGALRVGPVASGAAAAAAAAAGHAAAAAVAPQPDVPAACSGAGADPLGMWFAQPVHTRCGESGSLSSMLSLSVLRGLASGPDPPALAPAPRQLPTPSLQLPPAPHQGGPASTGAHGPGSEAAGVWGPALPVCPPSPPGPALPLPPVVRPTVELYRPPQPPPHQPPALRSSASVPAAHSGSYDPYVPYGPYGPYGAPGSPVHAECGAAEAARHVSGGPAPAPRRSISPLTLKRTMRRAHQAASHGGAPSPVGSLEGGAPPLRMGPASPPLQRPPAGQPAAKERRPRLQAPGSAGSGPMGRSSRTDGGAGGEWSYHGTISSVADGSERLRKGSGGGSSAGGRGGGSSGASVFAPPARPVRTTVWTNALYALPSTSDCDNSFFLPNRMGSAAAGSSDGGGGGGAGAAPTPGAGAAPTPGAGAAPTPGAGAAPTPGAGAAPTPGAGAAPTPGAGAVPSPGAGAAPTPGAEDAAGANPGGPALRALYDQLHAARLSPTPYAAAHAGSVPLTHGSPTLPPRGAQLEPASDPAWPHVGSAGVTRSPQAAAAAASLTSGLGATASAVAQILFGSGVPPPLEHHLH